MKDSRFAPPAPSKCDDASEKLAVQRAALPLAPAKAQRGVVHPSRPDLTKQHQTDSGNVERLRLFSQDRLVYCFELGRWHVWDGLRWKPSDSADEVRVAM